MTHFHSDRLVRHARGARRFAHHQDLALDVWENEGGALAPVGQSCSGYGHRRGGYGPVMTGATEARQ